MITNKKGDSLVSVLIGIFIISIMLLGLINILFSNYAVENDYLKKNLLLILQNNTENIVKNLDVSSLNEGDTFYIYKNNSNFEIYTGSVNANYKYINEFGDYISNTGIYDGVIYDRTLYVQKNDTTLLPQNQIIKIELKEVVKK